MKNKPQTKPQTKKENEHMQSVTTSRPCTITDSITQSCQEVRKMRDGKIPEKSLDHLFSDIEQWCSIFQTVFKCIKNSYKFKNHVDIAVGRCYYHSCVMQDDYYFVSLCGSVGIGRRARLKDLVVAIPCGFKSHLPH